MEEKDRKALENRRVVSRTFSLSPGDIALLEWGAEHLSTSQSDFMRSAIRAFATNLQAMEMRK